MTDEHECACELCTPEVGGSGFATRQGEHHFAVRFGDAGAQALKDGVEIFDCYEMLAGHDGTAWRFREPIHFCGCGRKGFCAYVDRGDFGIRVSVNRARMPVEPSRMPVEPLSPVFRPGSAAGLPVGF